MARAPWPGAERSSSGSRRFVIFPERPSRSSPGAGEEEASATPSSKLPERVSTFPPPRDVLQVGPRVEELGPLASGLEVATTAPCGSAASVSTPLCREATTRRRAGRRGAGPRRGQRSSARRFGMSFSELDGEVDPAAASAFVEGSREDRRRCRPPGRGGPAFRRELVPLRPDEDRLDRDPGSPRSASRRSTRMHCAAGEGAARVPILRGRSGHRGSPSSLKRARTAAALSSRSTGSPPSAHGPGRGGSWRPGSRERSNQLALVGVEAESLPPYFSSSARRSSSSLSAEPLHHTRRGRARQPLLEPGDATRRRSPSPRGTSAARSASFRFGESERAGPGRSGRRPRSPHLGLDVARDRRGRGPERPAAVALRKELPERLGNGRSARRTRWPRGRCRTWEKAASRSLHRERCALGLRRKSLGLSGDRSARGWSVTPASTRRLAVSSTVSPAPIRSTRSRRATRRSSRSARARSGHRRRLRPERGLGPTRCAALEGRLEEAASHGTSRPRLGPPDGAPRGPGQVICASPRTIGRAPRPPRRGSPDRHVAASPRGRSTGGGGRRPPCG